MPLLTGFPSTDGFSLPLNELSASIASFGEEFSSAWRTNLGFYGGFAFNLAHTGFGVLQVLCQVTVLEIAVMLFMAW